MRQRAFNLGSKAEVRPGTPVSSIALDERLTFLKRVYGWMSAALVVTVMGAAISIQSGIAEKILMSGFMGSILMFVGWVGLAFVGQRLRHTPTWNVVSFAAYAFFTGFVVSSMVYLAMNFDSLIAGEALGTGTTSMQYVYMALGATVLVFGTLTVYAMVTKRDFSWMRGMLVVALVVLIVGGIANIFIASSGFGILLAGFGVLLFSGFILYDTQKILKTYPSNEHVAASMTLFLDFVLLFMEILRLILYIAMASRE